MSKYKAHFLLDTQTVVDYVKVNLPFFDEEADLISHEIGDGNINYVFKILDLKQGRSLVLKQADTLLRSSGRPLAIQRSQIEADILKIQSSLVPEQVPRVYHYDPTMAVLAMEDISAYRNLRQELDLEQIYPDLADQISHFLVETLLSTTDLVMSRKEKKQQVQRFINIELCDISEDLVFTEPYTDYRKRNVITAGMEEFVTKHLYENSTLQLEIANLRNNYLNNAQALLHGDLHAGSIFINNQGIKVIDPEFAFYGPIGYDIGNVLAHLIFPLCQTDMINKKETVGFSEWLIETLGDVFDLTFEKFDKRYEELVQLSLYRLPNFKDQYLNDVKADAIGYMGTEIIRRVVGDSKVPELADLPVTSLKINLEKTLLTMASQLILERKNIKTGQELIGYYVSANNN
ncbi:S-methyl-5-thioribose kinase [Vagococcus intermedius]|uniref:S-methyl-5-thioribose kinase n=1 Tax=Vagococcus intermedius TaxID=2991418 RepID=A0AAF0CW77_9ENTE|nr:S-methyl-5-thioribose kinase [Vagococcus intermedius]WEG73837.1 S-methyl-5-thioribose kinase [Vagococcus intermedius]WEG75922.1 S-methyl-5-thioribose kinase [Vagococcus intermedius]